MACNSAKPAKQTATKGYIIVIYFTDYPLYDTNKVISTLSVSVDMDIPESHPRYVSLKTRQKLVEGVEKGITSKAGLIAHGRGEAFDYMIGEETTKAALKAERIAVGTMLDAVDPVISVNGNVAALVPDEIIALSNRLNAKLEVNLFHRTEERINRIVDWLKQHGADTVLGGEPDAEIPGLDHARALCTSEGIYSADVVLVPLEDGDRAQALSKMGKTVITIDLNPLSRTSRTADITIVDNIVRAVPMMIELEPLRCEFDNDDNLADVLEYMSERLMERSKGSV